MSRKYKYLDQDQLYFVSIAGSAGSTCSSGGSTKTSCRKVFRIVSTTKAGAVCLLHHDLARTLIIGTHKEPLPDIIRDLKSHTSESLHKAIKRYSGKSRLEWMPQ
ncbi:MAG TPA: hypothetical protein VD794_08275 [Flavisolibacter sp.]|nr:hypothetical protein [Flavisolibacter sp.]